jgi:hypothetical protein
VVLQPLERRPRQSQVAQSAYAEVVRRTLDLVWWLIIRRPVKYLRGKVVPIEASWRRYRELVVG